MGWLSGEDAVRTGLTTAYDTMQSGTSAYPQYKSSAEVAPATADYYNYTPTTPMASISTPNYQLNAGNAPEYKGMMAGDYDALQSALYQPAQMAAQNAYQQGYRNLNNAMGGQGLYGSSMMAQQANQGLDRTYQNALTQAAAQAASQRYGMQQQDLGAQNQFNQNMYNAALQRESNMNQFGGNMASLQMQQNANQWKAQNDINQQANQYNAAKQAYDLQQRQRQIDWQNQQGYEQNQYQLAQANYNNALRTQRINEALALSGAGQGAYGGQLQAAQIANQQKAAQNAQMGSLVGTGVGLLSQYGGSIASGIGGLYNSIFGGDSYTYGSDVGDEAGWNDYWDNYDYGE